MKVCVTADFHGQEPPAIPACDLLLFAGDLGSRERFSRQTDRSNSYRGWLDEQSAPTIIGIAGNHDWDSDGFRDLPWIYLENEDVTVDVAGTELKVWGSPLSPTFQHWAHMKSDRELARVWETIPEDVDVLLVHGPVHGFNDFAQREVHTGSESMRFLIDEGRFPVLKLVAHGHIHEGYGSTYEDGIVYVNGSWVDERYRPGNPPIVVEL